MLKKTYNNIQSKPRNLFLIDGLGALVSMFFLAVVLAQNEHIFGIPPTTLYFLATFPGIFALYDYYSYQKSDEVLGKFLNGIASMNLLYSFLSIGFAFYHYQEITYLGWIYMVLEIIIIVVLASIEFKVAMGTLSNLQ